MRDKQIGDDLLYSLHEKKKNTQKVIKQSKAGLNLFCGRHFDIDRNVLSVYFWSSSGDQNVIIKQAYLKHHHMALPLLGPRKNLKKKSLYKNAAKGEKYIPELQSQQNLIVSCVAAWKR